MKLAILLLLAIQVNAQQPYQNPQPPVVSVNSNVISRVTTNTVAKPEVQINIDTKQSISIQDQEPQKIKTFTKTFAVDKNDKINLSNQYGALTIKTWDKNEIKVDAEIKAFANSDADAQKLLDEVSISATKVGDLVSYKTALGERNGRWGSNVKNGKTIWRREVKVYYTVYMPAGNSLTASQQYGNLVMGDFAGATSLKVQYGDLTAGNLTNNNNYISIQYGKGEIQDLGGAQIKHQYGSGLRIGTVNTNLNLDAQYTTINIAAVKGASAIKHQYGGGVSIGTASGAINANMQYCTLKIENLNGNFTGRSQYGKVIMENVSAGHDVDIDAQYSNVSLRFAPNYHADFDVKTSYAHFKYGNNVTASRTDEGRSYSQQKNYIGQIGRGGSAKVIVQVQYNGVEFK